MLSKILEAELKLAKKRQEEAGYECYSDTGGYDDGGYDDAYSDF